MYGATSYGGTANFGTVYSLTPPAVTGGAWTETVLYSFAGGSDGATPYYGPLAVAGNGTIYGTTSAGGAANAGTVFSLTPPLTSGGAWTESVIFSFSGGADGANPLAGVIIGTDGILYGTASAGGIAGFEGYGEGTIFSLTPPTSQGLPWSQTVLYSFTGPIDGATPSAVLSLGANGTLYGTATYGGAADYGAIFCLTPPGSSAGTWTQSTLLTFTGANGAWPLAGVVFDASGVIYGTTQGGGAAGRGVAFALAPPTSAGQPWTESVLYSFTGLTDGGIPTAALVVGPGGVLYGNTEYGGASNAGVIFSLTPPSSAGTWTEAVLYNFTGLSNGGWPIPGMLAGPGGTLYGTACCGGTPRDGSAFLYQLPQFAISGQVTASGSGINGITIVLTGDQNITATTSGAGNYSFAVTGGGNYSVTPSSSTDSFTPISDTFTRVNSNQIANFLLNTNVISGRITLAGAALSGIAITVSGSLSATANTDLNGNYSLTLPTGGSYTITPSSGTYTFNPSSLTFNDLTVNAVASFAASIPVALYVISGRVTNQGNAVSGVAITLGGSQTGSVTTTAQGAYSFTVPAAGNYSVTPSLAGYSFTPSSLAFSALAASQTTADFTAGFTISGQVTLSGYPVPGVTMTLAGVQSGTATTDSAGSFSMPVAAAGSYTLTPSLTGYTFNPISTELNLTASQTLNFAAQCGTLSPASIDLDASAQSGPAITVTGTANCAWIASGNGFVNLPAPVSAIGNGSIGFTVTANTSAAIRTGAISAAGQTVVVTQRATSEVFSDVPPTAYYFDFADILEQAGITGGCSSNPPDYCPDSNTTRGEMAVFLVAAIEAGNGFAYTETPYFTDVPASSPYFIFIQKLKDLGITNGCAATSYCPNDSVTRAEMAALIVASRYNGTPYTYPSTAFFSDVAASSPYFPFVQKMAQAGITGGCGGGLYCPGETLSRGQMAVLLVAGLLNRLLPAGTPLIASASPNSVEHGQAVTVTLTGANTHFAQGASQIALPPGIAPSNMVVLNQTTLSVELSIAASVAANPITIVVTTGTEEAVLPNGFVIR